MKNLAVFASGNGTNFQSLCDAVKTNKLHVNLKLLVVDRKDAFVIERAKKEKIPCFIFSSNDYSSKEEYEKEILNQLQLNSIDFIALAGYMRILGSILLKPYANRIVNIHPSLLPAFKGKDAIQQAIDYGVKIMGVTIHYVDDGMDTGKIIAQDCFTLMGDETIEQIENQVHAIEHRLYPNVLKKLLEE